MKIDQAVMSKRGRVWKVVSNVRVVVTESGKIPRQAPTCLECQLQGHGCMSFAAFHSDAAT